MGGVCSSLKSGRTKNRRDGQGPRAGSQVRPEDVGFIDSLPANVEEVTVHHVYDGDTMTIVRRSGEQRRVRFLGIDAPELKEKEPYAVEAADYMKMLCKKNATVWLKFEMGRQEDKYGRLLAYVFVKNPDGGPGFILTNAAILGEGLAYYYVLKDEPLSYSLMLLTAQRKALEASRNLWSTINLDKQVFITRNGAAFHLQSCKNIQSANLSSLSVAAAFDRGLSPCRTCQPV